MQIRIRDLVNPGYRIRDGKSRIRNTAQKLYNSVRKLVAYQKWQRKPEVRPNEVDISRVRFKFQRSLVVFT
jgi:hypothetical protein